ncbi:Ig-like domain-containing protein [Desulfosporosinus acididurans]|uniref:Ig-like domain-containing protein n=1 Tax=Desulfosporosinus acididurans TaxID=476652 RepID=UPI0006497CC9|nr:Ig-like domain-containing protein [Desulfosporosinus acididurans]
MFAHEEAPPFPVISAANGSANTEPYLSLEMDDSPVTTTPSAITAGQTPVGNPSLTMMPLTKPVWDGTPLTADPDYSYSGGTGADEENAYLIADSYDLAMLAANVKADGSYSQGKFFKLTADIDLNPGVTLTAASTTAKRWTPIGKSYGYEFTGTFDGGGHHVKGVYINNPSTPFQGLFGFIKDAVVQNLGVTDSFIKGSESVGGVVGQTYDMGSSANNTTTAAQVPVTRQTLSNQQSWDTIALDFSHAATAVTTATQTNASFIQVEDPGAVAQVQLTVPDTVVSSVTSAALGLNLTSPIGGVQISAATLQAASPRGTNLVATVTPVIDSVQTNQIQGAVFTAIQSSGSGGLSGSNPTAVIGQSVNIETNLNTSELAQDSTPAVQILVPLTGLTPPSDPAQFGEWKNSLGVYIQHSDGSTEYLTVQNNQCTIQYDSSGNPSALMVSVKSFSIFTPFVSYVPVSGISVTPTTLALTAGGSAGTLTASINPSNASNQSVTWTSSNPSIASVSGSGLTATVTPISAGMEPLLSPVPTILIAV